MHGTKKLAQKAGSQLSSPIFTCTQATEFPIAEVNHAHGMTSDLHLGPQTTSSPPPWEKLLQLSLRLQHEESLSMGETFMSLH